LKCTVQKVVEDDEALAKVPQVKQLCCIVELGLTRLLTLRTLLLAAVEQLLVLVKSVRYVDEEIVAVLHVSQRVL
jgi:hypothetical protein